MTLPILPTKGSTDWYDWATALDSAVRSGTGGGSGSAGVISVKDYGAVGNGTTDDSAAFAGAVAAAKASLRTLPYTLQGEKSVSVVIDVPAGDYLITDPGSVLGDEAMTINGRGLIFRGAHSHSSNLIFKPATAGVMMTNDYWMFIRFEHLGFLAGTSGCTFLLSNTSHAAQRYSFFDCRWERWKYAFDLRGTDNNSEFTLLDCHAMFHQDDGVFFFVGTSGSDQFLNYWFTNMTYWSTQAPFIDATYGGSFHLTNLDVSGWGSGLASTKYLFNLRGTSHSEGVCTFEATGLRWEPMSASAALLFSEWPQGSIVFRSLDMTSQVITYTYGDVIYLDTSANTDGPIVAFYDSQLAGGVRIKMGVLTYGNQHITKFTNCTWLQKNSPSDVVSYDTSATSGNVLPFPPVDFIDCRNRTNDVWATAGATVWTARIGYRGQGLQTLTRRVLSVRGPYGPALGTETNTVTLPQGAIITALQAVSPAGTSGEADGGTWTLATTDATPVTVATAVVSGAMSAGFDVTTNLTPPFLCSTAARSKLKVSATNVAQGNSGALLLIHGYW